MTKFLQKFLIACFMICSFVTFSEVKADDRIAIIFDAGGKFDKSFNESAYRGIERAKKELGIDYYDFEVKNNAQIEQAISRMARKSDLVIVIGFTNAIPLKNLAPKFPDTKFLLIDAVVDAPNVKSVTFKEHEGSFLVGALAAMKSKTGKIGFVGGMDVPIIRKFELGYYEGARFINPNIQTVGHMVGSDNATAWTDPVKAKELAIAQKNRGVDVIFHAAGPSGVGVLQAAQENDFFGIGVDSNQNYMFPGSVLTSMIKAVDVAVYSTIDEYLKNDFQAGQHIELGLAEDGVGYSIDQYNEKLITPKMAKKLTTIRKKIISGELVVPDFTKKSTKK